MKLQRIIKTQIKNPWAHLILLALLLGLLYSRSNIKLMDDSYYYQKFTETLVNEGRLDFSLPGFHGADFLTAPIYFVTHSPYAVAILDMIAAIANIFLIYLAVNQIFKDKKLGVFAAYIYLLNPIDYYNPLRGHHHTPLMALVFLGLYLLFRNSKWTSLSFGFSYIIRPFGIAFAPLFIYQKKIKQLLLSLIVPVVYVILEYWQIGKVFIGAHNDLTPETLFSIKRFILNLGYAFQNYFSIHNYSFLNPLDSLDMIHLSPLITFFALLGVLYPKKYFSDLKLFWFLFASAAIALILPAMFVHLDMWHLWTFNFALILISLPVIVKFTKALPVVVLSFGFQFLYLYLAGKNVFWNDYTIFIIPVVIFIISIVYTFYQINYKKDENYSCS